MPGSVLLWKQRPGKIIPCIEAIIFTCFLLAQEVLAQETQVEGGKKGGLGMAAMRHLVSESKKNLDNALKHMVWFLGLSWGWTWWFWWVSSNSESPWLYNPMFHKVITAMELVHTQRSHPAYKETSGSICLRTTHWILLHCSQPFFPSKGRNPSLLWNISYFKHFLKQPAAHWNVFMCSEKGEVITHFHRADYRI